MAKRRESAFDAYMREKKADNLPRPVGTHKGGCGGEVTYLSTGTQGILTCRQCGESSHKGKAPDYERYEVKKDYITMIDARFCNQIGTPKQHNYACALASKAGYTTLRGAASEYFGISVSACQRKTFTVKDASGFIEWLKGKA